MFGRGIGRAEIGRAERAGEFGFVELIVAAQQIALLDVISLFAVEDAPGAAEPAPGATHLSAGGERHPDPEGVAHGGKCLAGVQPCAACSLQRVQVVLLTAEHVGRGGEQLEVLRAEAGLLVGCGERLARRRPGARRVRAATPL